MSKNFQHLKLATFLALAAAHCASAQQGDEDDGAAALAMDGLDPLTLRAEASEMFGVLPSIMQSTKHPISDAKVNLGRQLFYDTRLSKNQDLSCNSCHDLTAYGVDRRPGAGKTSLGHRGQIGTRNGPSVYNAARQFVQFWDGRAVDVEEQAKGPIINPIEMAMPNAMAVVTVIKSIPGYAPLFSAAFSGTNAITYDNIGIAIGAFERKLVTKDRFDMYMAGETDALTPAESHGFAVFLRSGCPSCHDGPGLGGNDYQKLGSLKPYQTTDLGRYAITKREADRYMFKVPSLRNIDKTGPYFHDGSQATLEAAVRTMSDYQTVEGVLSEPDINAVATFLRVLTGVLPTEYIVAPAPLAGSATTPRPDPT
jgi:cytochrome c peroxidase